MPSTPQKEPASPAFQAKVDSLKNLDDAFKKLDSGFKSIKQAFQLFKMKSFFFPEPEFTKSFTVSANQVECHLQDMGGILSSFVSQQSASTGKEEPEQKKQDKEGDTRAGAHTTELLEVKTNGAANSITPPASEAGNDEEVINNASMPGLDHAKGRGKEGAQGGRSAKKRDNAGLSVNTPPQKRSRRSLINDYLKKEEDEKKPVISEEKKEVKKEEEEFEVECIVDIKRNQSQVKYRVKWKGYGHQDNTWEPPSNLTGCEDLLFEFYKDRFKKRHNLKTEDLNSVMLPMDYSNKEVLYRAFHVYSTPNDEDNQRGLQQLVSSKPPVLLTDKEVEEMIEKAMHTRKHENYLNIVQAIVTNRVMKETKKQRQWQLAELRTWERHINSICSASAHLAVENYTDLALPSANFTYINTSLAGEGVTIPCDPVVGCECDDCYTSKSCCPNQMNTYMAYNKYGRLKVSLGTPIYECNNLCRCDPSCFNRVVQKGQTAGLCIFRTQNNRGWGVKATDTIKKDSLVIEYVGEVITSEEAERRGKIYDAQGCTYLFDLDYNKGDQNPYTIDAAKCGNVSHFINHSCDPNLVVFNVWVNCLDPDLPRLALFATRDIRRGEELTFDYNSGLKREQMTGNTVGDTAELNCTPDKGDQPSQTSSELILKTPKGNRGLQYGKTECRCGAANCRRYFF